MTIGGERRARARERGRPAPTPLDALHLIDDRLHELTQVMYDVREVVRALIAKLEVDGDAHARV